MRGIKRGELIGGQVASPRNRSLVCTLLSIPLLSLCFNADAIPVKAEIRQSERAKQKTLPSCGFEGSVFHYVVPDGKRIAVPGLLRDPNEKILGTSCSKKFAFAISDKNMYFIFGAPKETKGGSGSLKESFRFWPLEKETKRFGPLVSFAFSEDRCFLLFRDGVIREHFAGEDYVDNNRIPFKTENARMAYFSGFLFIAPVEGKMVIIETSSGESKYKIHPLPKHFYGGSAHYMIKKNRLFFGVEGKMLEIVTEAANLSKIKIKEKR